MPKRVVIIGGSAAGLYAAHRLAQAGVPVRVYEAIESVDPVSRTLIVTDKFREQMGDLAPRAIVNEIRTFELFSNGDRASVELQRPDLIIERTEVIKVLAEQAREAGAEIITRQRLVGLEAADDGTGNGGSGGNGSGGAMRLSFAPTERRAADEDRREALRRGAPRRGRPDPHLEITADVVIGADGAFSTVARQAGWPQQPTVPLVQAIVPFPGDMAPDSTKVWFVPEDTPFFYWLIPDRPGRGGLGVIGDQRPGGKKPREVLEAFLERQGLEALEFQAAKVPLYVKWIPVHRKVGRGDVYLVGDAAGQVKVSTVGGIVTGFRGAHGVVDVLLHSNGNGGGHGRAAHDGDLPRPKPRIQADNGATNGKIRALRRELDLHMWIRKAMHDFEGQDYSHLLGLLNASAMSSLGRFHRDETWRLMWNLLLRQPRLLALGLRGLLFGRGLGR